MKKLLLLLVAVTLCGCDIKNQHADYNCGDVFTNVTYYAACGVQRFDFEGHRYLSVSQGGLIHAESCHCKTNQVVAKAHGWKIKVEEE